MSVAVCSGARALVIAENRIATKQDLFAIQYLNLTGSGFSTLSRVSRSWLSFYLALVKQGFFRITAPMGAICDAHRNAGGTTGSIRSAYRAHAELEGLGYITRQTMHLGDNSKRSDIRINRERFDFLVSRSDTVPHVPEWQVSSPTSTPDLLHPNYPVVSRSNRLLKSNFNANTGRTKDEEPLDERSKKCANWINPLLYTIGVVLRSERVDGADLIQQRARASLVAGGLLGGWTPAKWWEMTHAEREHVCRSQLIPLLVSADPSCFNNQPVKKEKYKGMAWKQAGEKSVSGLGGSLMAFFEKAPMEPIGEDIMQAIRNIAGTNNIEISGRTEKKPPPLSKSVPAVEMVLDDDELKILQEAKRKMQFFTDGT